VLSGKDELEFRGRLGGARAEDIRNFGAGVPDLSNQNQTYFETSGKWNQTMDEWMKFRSKVGW